MSPAAPPTSVVDDVIRARHTVRGFKPDPVPDAVVAHLLATASHAPSGSNIQPWRIHVVRGAALDALARDLLAEHDAQTPPAPEYDYYPATWRSPYLERRRECGWGLYRLTGVERGDHAASHRQRGRNFTFYDAPVAMIVTVDTDMGRGSLLDTGMFVQSLMLAARGHGLDTCPQVAVVSYPAVLRAHLGLGPEEMAVCGVGLGWADPDEPANALHTSRVPVERFTTFH